MPRRKRSPRTPSQAAADRRADDLVGRLGGALRGARKALRLSQSQAAERAGFARSTWSGLEVARDGRVTLATVNRAAMALGTNLRAYFEHASAASQPRDATHLRHQELIIQTASSGGWKALPEAALDRDARTSRAADVLLERAGEYAITEVWDWFDDVGAALRDWDRRLDALDRYATARLGLAAGNATRSGAGDEPVALPNVGGCWVVRATRRNRLLVSEHRHLFMARFTGSGHAWLAALTTSLPMPQGSALLWVAVDGRRLFPARSVERLRRDSHLGTQGLVTPLSSLGGQAAPSGASAPAPSGASAPAPSMRATPKRL